MGALAAVAPVFGFVVAAGLLLGSSAEAVAVGPAGIRAEAVLRAASPFYAPSSALVDPAPPPIVAATVPTAEEELAAQLARQLLGAKVVGNKIEYAGGAVVFVAIDAGVLSMSSCSANRFCIWDESNLQGSLWSLSAAGVAVAMPTYFGSVAQSALTRRYPYVFVEFRRTSLETTDGERST
jgi:hypothetical protein